MLPKPCTWLVKGIILDYSLLTVIFNSITEKECSLQPNLNHWALLSFKHKVRYISNMKCSFAEPIMIRVWKCSHAVIGSINLMNFFYIIIHDRINLFSLAGEFVQLPVKLLSRPLLIEKARQTAKLWKIWRGRLADRQASRNECNGNTNQTPLCAYLWSLQTVIQWSYQTE